VSSINQDIEKKSAPKEAAPESSGAPETSTAAPEDPTLSMVDTSSALFQLPANPPCDQVRDLDCDSDDLCDGECKTKNFSLGLQVSNAKRAKGHAGAQQNQAMAGSSDNDDDEHDAPDDADADDEEGGTRDMKTNDRKAKRIQTTTGTMWAVCECGLTAPGIEMVRSEGCSMAMRLVQGTFGNCDTWPRFMAYDDMVRSCTL